MKMLTGLIGGFLLATVVWLVLVLGQEGNRTPAAEWVRQAYAFKNERAREIDEPKLVIVSGSNALFGLHSARLAEAYKRPVVNQAVNAGVGLPYIIEQGQSILKPGDIALLPLEFPLFSYHYNTNQVMIDYYFAEPGLLYQQPWRLQMALLTDITLTRIYEGYKGMPDDFKVSGLYGVHHLNAQGDQIYSDRVFRGEVRLQQLKGLKPSLYGEDFSSDNEGWQLLSRFQRWAEQQNICLIYVPATMMFNPLYRDDPVEAQLYLSLASTAAQFGLRYVGNPYDFMYGPEHYFDTNYHLIAESRLDNTQRLIDLLGSDLRAHCP